MNDVSMNSRLLTWLDVERVFKRNTAHATQFPLFITGVRCYAGGAEVEHSGTEAGALNWLVQIFGQAFDSERHVVRLAIGDQQYPMELLAGGTLATTSLPSYPLWTDVAYMQEGNVAPRFPAPWTDGPKLVAFHSFKGGVGRTTALMNYVAASLEAADDNPVRLLVIDADLEAPGISFWLDEVNRPKVSFTQLLEALHYPPVDINGSLDFFAIELRKTSLDAGSARRELFVLPAALDVIEMMDMPVRPEHLARNPNDPWQLSEHLKELGRKLDVDYVFIDLRAGLSELSSPLLFDPRIEHFFVTTVAPQSVKGMAAILGRLYALQSKMSPPDAMEAKPSVILSMLTPTLRELPAYSEAQEALGAAYPGLANDVLSSGVEWLEYDFAESLMSLRSVREAIDVSRKSSSLYPEALAWAVNSIRRPTTVRPVVNVSQTVQVDADKLHKLCERVQFAEQIATDEMLATEPLRNLGKHFSAELPNAVSVGAKGAGKTFAFLQVCRAKTWQGFLGKLEVSDQLAGEADIFPVLWSSNLGDAAVDAVLAAREQFVPCSVVESGLMGRSEIERRINVALKTPDHDWAAFWDGLICAQLGVQGDSLVELNDWLTNTQRQVVLVFDGIEDSFENLVDSSSRDAVKGLLQLPNRLSELRGRRVGAVVFVRADYVQAAIRQNVAQYLARFTPFSLDWTPESFLRLSYWLCGQAGIIGADPKRAEELTVAEILDVLEKLWGKKLGRADSKEARSALWVFGALCDLKGRFQARDLVRFLKVAAGIQTIRQGSAWVDRVLAPESMRSAIPKCSEEKVGEAVKEIAVLSDWKEKLDGLPAAERRVPFDPASLGLSPEGLNSLRELGVIYEDTDQKNSAERFYLPEIYRQGLGFETSVAGRPRTLALLKRNLPKLPF